MLVEMRWSAVLGRLGQVGGQLRLRQVQDGLGEVADGVEDAAWELGLQDGHLGSDEGRRRGLHRGGRLWRHGGRGRRGWGLLLLRRRRRRRWRRRGLLGRRRGLLGPGGRGLLHLLVVVVMVLQTDRLTSGRRHTPGYPQGPRGQAAAARLLGDTRDHVPSSAPSRGAPSFLTSEPSLQREREGGEALGERTVSWPPRQSKEKTEGQFRRRASDGEGG